MLGQMMATFSIILSSTRSEGAFFSVATTTPLVAGARASGGVERGRAKQFRGKSEKGDAWSAKAPTLHMIHHPVLTLDTETRRPARNSRERMLDLDQLARRRKGREREAVSGEETQADAWSAESGAACKQGEHARVLSTSAWCCHGCELVVGRRVCRSYLGATTTTIASPRNPPGRKMPRHRPSAAQRESHRGRCSGSEAPTPPLRALHPPWYVLPLGAD